MSEDNKNNKDLQENINKLDDGSMKADEKKKTNNTELNTGFFLPIGTGLGVSFGVIFDNLVMGIIVGTALGLVVGSIVESTKSKK